MQNEKPSVITTCVHGVLAGNLCRPCAEAAFVRAEWAGYAAPELKAPADVTGPDEVDRLQARVRELERDVNRRTEERDVARASLEYATKKMDHFGVPLGVPRDDDPTYGALRARVRELELEVAFHSDPEVGWRARAEAAERERDVLRASIEGIEANKASLRARLSEAEGLLREDWGDGVCPDENCDSDFHRRIRAFLASKAGGET